MIFLKQPKAISEFKKLIGKLSKRLVTAGNQISVLDDHSGEVAHKQNTNTQMWRA